MSDLDLVKADKKYYSAKREPGRMPFEALPYVTITGQGSPDGPGFAQATEALYTVAYGVRAIWKAGGSAFTVAKLEGLWWVEDEQDVLKVPREEWRWKLLIRMPEGVKTVAVEDAKRSGTAKKKDLADGLGTVGFETIREDDCVQMLHVGPYSTEPHTLECIHRYMTEHGLVQNGLHHEIYLSDPRKTAPEALKTILRLPVAAAVKPAAKNM